jgi:hypothetical protein
MGYVTSAVVLWCDIKTSYSFPVVIVGAQWSSTPSSLVCIVFAVVGTVTVDSIVMCCLVCAALGDWEVEKKKLLVFVSALKRAIWGWNEDLILCLRQQRAEVGVRLQKDRGIGR